MGKMEAFSDAAQVSVVSNSLDVRYRLPNEGMQEWVWRGEMFTHVCPQLTLPVGHAPEGSREMNVS